MSSPAPILRIPVPGGRGGPGSRAPRLGLAIPVSPQVKPVNGAAEPPEMSSLPKPAPPSLRLATPSGTSSTPHERKNRLPPLQIFGVSANGAPSDASARSRSESFGDIPANGSATHHFQQILRQPSADPLSAAGSAYSAGAGSDTAPAMERENSVGLSILPDLEKLAIQKGGPLDVEDLDDAAWLAASKEHKIEELGSLGEGAGGAVTRCKLKGGKTVFALKVITTDPNPDVKKQIFRELQFNKDCASDHICKYYGAYMDDSLGTISIAMEYCEGGSLDSVYREVKKRGSRTGEKVLGKVAEGVLHGLTYLHGRRIIHRDVKPSNILLCRNGQVKLCDFGVSGEFGTRGDANTFIGTSYYMAPERITCQPYTITSDVWSLGVTLLEVAQHRFPFPADGTEMRPKAGLIDLLTYIVRQDIPELKDEPEHNLVWSENFKYFVRCCLEKELKRRATPWKLLEHPWMVDIASRRVNMAKFLSQVWEWTS